LPMNGRLCPKLQYAGGGFPRTSSARMTSCSAPAVMEESWAPRRCECGSGPRYDRVHAGPDGATAGPSEDHWPRRSFLMDWEWGAPSPVAASVECSFRSASSTSSRISCRSSEPTRESGARTWVAVVREAAQVSAPATASALAVSTPIPDEAPVTIPRLPVRSTPGMTSFAVEVAPKGSPAPSWKLL